jgi:hypothetical protein
LALTHLLCSVVTRSISGLFAFVAPQIAEEHGSIYNGIVHYD